MDTTTDELGSVEEFEAELRATLRVPGGTAHYLAELARLELAETLRGTEVRYVLARTDDGRCTGVLPVYRTRAALPPALAGLGPAREGEPVHLLGSPGAVASHLVVAPDTDPARRATSARLLLAHGLRTATAHGPGPVLIPYLDTDGLALVPPSLAETAVVRTVPVARLDITWNGFEEYVSSLGKSRRTGIRKERRRFLESDVVVSEEHLLDVCEEIAPLVLQVEQRYARATTAEQIEFYLTGLGLAMDDSGFALVARRDGAVIGACVVWEYEDEWVVRCWGCDYSRTDRESVYFNMVFYETVERAVARRIPRVRLGPESIATKITRGCAVDELHTLLVRPPRP
ncbi:GNAT family N-acetyltransferase [Streptomyces sp. NPDC031705]|uniref:GNAT family N-acetyltransferase n=1 Tax=Streptomyces sp. NPDC031705 TaxID=3155729 RepID=UPI0033F4F866